MSVIYFLVNLMIVAGCMQDQGKNNSEWKEIRTAEDLWKYDPNLLRSLFDKIDFQQPELSAVNSAIAKGDTVEAAEQLVEHFKNSHRDWVVTTMEAPAYDDVVRVADALLADTLMLKGEVAKIPWSNDAGWQWNYTGPSKDDEFGYSLNGHRYLLTLLVANKETKDEKYVGAFDRIMKDWVIHHPLPTLDDSIYVVLDPTQSIDWRDIGEVEWRTLQAGQRLGATWPQTFYAFQEEDIFSPATRLLMLSSIAEQAGYLRNYHKEGHNWTTMEMNGLALAALAFPEFKDSDNWASYALEVMTKEINRQVYPDGVQTEVSTLTQWVALNRFQSVANNFIKSGRKISPSYLKRIEEMYNYLAYCMRPDGHQPLNSDADRADLRPRVLPAVEIFDRLDWEWIATNGKKGSKPMAGPSVTFPWAGIHISRSGWDVDASWSFFDNGPYGTGHQHRDKLHLSVAAFGKDLLVDAGRYTHQDYFSFDPMVWRGYFRSSFSHNVILVDGHGQNAGPELAEKPLVDGVDFVNTELYDYAKGTFDSGFEAAEAIHSRSVLYVKNKFWVVVDQIETDQPRQIQALWHYAPDCEVMLDEKEVISINENEGNLRIVPVGKIDWQAKIVAGQEKPVIQGWYSGEYDVKVQSPTVVYSANISGPTTFVWILVAAKGEVPPVKAGFHDKKGVISMKVSIKDEAPIRISLPLASDASQVKVKF